MKRNKKLLLLGLMGALLLALAGCSSTKTPVTATSGGFWDHYFVYPLSMALTKIAEWAGGSYGLSIIIATVIIRLVLLPLILKQQKSTMAMQALRPEMEKIQKKYAGKKDPETQQKQQKEMMQLYQTHKINPVGGCLPIFIQMPIIIAFYNAIARTHEIAQHSFLWVSLGKPDPYFILPVVAAITTFLQIRVSMTDEIQPPMKMMMNIMPIFILVAGISLPSALALYWVIGNLFGIGQGYYLKKRMSLLKEKDAANNAAQAKTKPSPKSKSKS
ncbi:MULTISPECIES: membrane protein insertase YidC [Priestia]|uniref:Membrane protein insertase YidC n=4 Tax=Priestia TaxID=2800373 RepID=A0A2S1EV32_PRIMG|nr:MULTISPECIES: membrane protein insertase YidC [Priestia]MBK0293860.1 membrane protein insertase YidC [Bacillus sp. S34]MCL9636221.1 membrane protein insertase YidC [Bacillus zanthoxyli]NHH95593.1 Membrane protein insertase YidC 2 [Bacillus sp. MB95]UPK51229.1 membrane protein insertase YidC [Bacillus sp. H8-1]AEN88095.1 Preprotein translocase subunit YidC [Priestia megaterium WSH-002]